MLKLTDYFDDSALTELEQNDHGNVGYSLFYTPLIGGFTVSFCLFLFGRIAECSLYDDSIY